MTLHRVEFYCIFTLLKTFSEFRGKILGRQKIILIDVSVERKETKQQKPF